MSASSHEAARALDGRDPLRSFRERFVIDDAVVYLDGNSLGRLPIPTAARLRQVVEEEWGRGLIRSWASWLPMPGSVGDLLATAALGADAGQVLVADTTTLNLHKMLHAACQLSDRPEILVERGAFPTDRYVAEGVAAQTGRRLRVVEGPLEEAFTSSVATAAFSAVDYRSGVRADVPAVTAAAHATGATVVWDLSHAAGALDLRLDAWEVDFAVGCTYKYLNAGPGAPAFLYVAGRHLARVAPVIPGWMGHARPFAMADEFEASPTIERFLTGTPDVRGIAAVEEGARLVAEAGAALLEEKAASLTGLCIDAVDELLDAEVEVVTPCSPRQRGSHIAIRHPEAWQLCQALIADHAVIPDFREPDIVRLGFAPLYTTHAEVVAGVRALAEVLSEGSHRRFPAERSGVT